MNSNSYIGREIKRYTHISYIFVYIYVYTHTHTKTVLKVLVWSIEKSRYLFQSRDKQEAYSLILEIRRRYD